MSLIQDILQKLDKMTFIFYPDPPSEDKPGGTPKATGSFDDDLKKAISMNTPTYFPVLYNPTSFNETHSVEYCSKGPTGDTKDQEFKSAKPKDFKVELLFDSTKISAANLFSDGLKGIIENKGVDVIINTFVNMAMGYNKSKHRPPFCQIVWGPFHFEGVVKNIDISYLLFNRQGRPIRAKVTVTAVSQIQDKKSAAKVSESPDLTKLHTVRAGETLPLISLKEYDSEDFYLELARVNKLKNYRKLKPGQVLVLPPIKKLEA